MGFVGPYFWYKRPGFSASRLIPIHLDITDGATGEHTVQYGPYFQIDGPGRKSRVLFPFFGRYDDATEHDLYIFPTYFRQRLADGYELDTFIPLYWRSKWQGRTTRIIGPWYDPQRPGRPQHRLLPHLLLREERRAQRHRRPAAAALPARRLQERHRDVDRAADLSHLRPRHGCDGDLPAVVGGAREGTEPPRALPDLLELQGRRREERHEPPGADLLAHQGGLVHARHPAHRLVHAQPEGRQRVERADAALL